MRIGGDAERILDVQLSRFSALLELGRVREAESELALMRRSAVELRIPAYQWMVVSIAGMLALMRGEIDQAEELMSEELSVGTSSITSEAGTAYRAHAIGAG